MSLSLMPLTLKADPIGTKVLIRLYYDVHRADLGKSSRSPIAPISVLQTDNVLYSLTTLQEKQWKYCQVILLSIQQSCQKTEP